MIDVTLPPYSCAADGVTDDSAAIQRALDALDDNRIYFPPGRAFSAKNLNVPSGKTILAEGATFRLALSNKAQQYLFKTIVGSHDITHVGGSVIGDLGPDPGQPVPGISWSIGWFIDGASKVTLREVRFSDWYTDCVKMDGPNANRATGVAIEHCRMERAIRNCMSIVNAQAVTVIGSVFVDTIAVGAPNFVNNPGAGVDVEPSIGNRTDGVEFYQCGFHGCRIGLYDQPARGGASHKIIECGFLDNREIGLVVNSVRGGLIAGNMILNSPIGASIGGFSEDGRARDVNIVGNVVSKCAVPWRFAGAADVVAVGNRWSKEPKYVGLGIAGECVVTNNRLVPDPE